VTRKELFKKSNLPDKKLSQVKITLSDKKKFRMKRKPGVKAFFHTKIRNFAKILIISI
jgi:hypothetical protein